MENTNRVQRSELWEKIYNVVKQIPREAVDGDAMDASSATTEIEKILSSQLEQIVMQKPAKSGDGKIDKEITLCERALKLIGRARELGLTKEQKHIDSEDSPEKEYWHYGYGVGLLDVYNNFILKEIKKD